MANNPVKQQTVVATPPSPMTMKEELEQIIAEREHALTDTLAQRAVDQPLIAREIDRTVDEFRAIALALMLAVEAAPAPNTFADPVAFTLAAFTAQLTVEIRLLVENAATRANTAATSARTTWRSHVDAEIRRTSWARASGHPLTNGGA